MALTSDWSAHYAGLEEPGSSTIETDEPVVKEEEAEDDVLVDARPLLYRKFVMAFSNGLVGPLIHALMSTYIYETTHGIELSVAYLTLEANATTMNVVTEVQEAVEYYWTLQKATTTLVVEAIKVDKYWHVGEYYVVSDYYRRKGMNVAAYVNSIVWIYGYLGGEERLALATNLRLPGGSPAYVLAFGTIVSLQVQKRTSVQRKRDTRPVVEERSTAPAESKQKDKRLFLGWNGTTPFDTELGAHRAFAAKHTAIYVAPGRKHTNPTNPPPHKKNLFPVNWIVAPPATCHNLLIAMARNVYELFTTAPLVPGLMVSFIGPDIADHPYCQLLDSIPLVYRSKRIVIKDMSMTLDPISDDETRDFLKRNVIQWTFTRSR